MKKADLKPGMLVAVKEGYSINKAVVLEVGTHWGRTWGGVFVKKAKPTQAVAIALDIWRGEWRPRLVLPRQVIATWEAYEAAQEKESQRRQAEREKQDAAYKKSMMDHTTAQQRVAKYGVALYTCSFEQGCVLLTLADLNKLIDLLDGKGSASDWQIHDERKAELVEKKVRKLATTEELQELDGLKRLTSARRSLYAPLPLAELAKVKAELIRKGRWLDE